MLFYLTTLNFASFLGENDHVIVEGEQDRPALKVVGTWKNSVFLWSVRSNWSCMRFLPKEWCWALPGGGCDWEVGSSWKDFKNYLKHKRKPMNMKDFIVRLRIEKDNKRIERKMGNTYMAEANVVLHGQSSGAKKKQSNKQ